MSDGQPNIIQIGATIVGILAASGGVSYGTSKVQEGAHSNEVRALERDVDTLKQLMREETRERTRMIRELSRDLRTEMRLAGYSVDSSMDYYMLEAPAMAAEEVMEDVSPPVADGD